jgi:L-amino acid N-acyltransferase YncA
MWRALTQDSNKIIFIAEDTEGNVVGFSALGSSRDSDANPDTAEVGAIYVHPEKWGKGIGRTLLSMALGEVRSASLTNLPCGYWKQTSEHALFTNHSNLCRMVP